VRIVEGRQLAVLFEYFNGNGELCDEVGIVTLEFLVIFEERLFENYFSRITSCI
jgi:hypothetical protein